MGVFTNADAILGSLSLRNIRNTSITSNGQVINNTLSSGVLGQLLGGRKDVRASFTSEDVAGVAGVANIATSGLIINPGTITIPFQRRKNFSTFESGSLQYAASGTIGCVYPVSFAAQDEGNATVNLETVFASADGTTAPLTESGTAALGAQAVADLYAMGPVVVNGTTIDCPQSVTINTGIQVRPFFCQGNTFAKTVFIVPPTVPTITVESPALEQFLTSIGGWTAGTSIVVTFLKRSTTGFAGTGSITFSFADGIIDVGVSSSSGQDASKSITFTGELLTIGAGV